MLLCKTQVQQQWKRNSGSSNPRVHTYVLRMRKTKKKCLVCPLLLSNCGPFWEISQSICVLHCWLWFQNIGTGFVRSTWNIKHVLFMDIMSFLETF